MKEKINSNFNILYFSILILMAGVLFSTGCAIDEKTEISISLDENNYLLIKNNTDQSIALNKPFRMQRNEYVNLHGAQIDIKNKFAYIYLLNKNGEKIFACGSLHYWGNQAKINIPKGETFRDDIFVDGPSIKELYCLEPGTYRMILEVGQADESIDSHGLKTLYKSNSLDVIIN